jgi:hypothetical protein
LAVTTGVTVASAIAEIDTAPNVVTGAPTGWGAEFHVTVDSDQAIPTE